MLTKTGIKIRICSSTGKRTQHLEQDSKFTEPLPSTPQVLDGPQRSGDRLQPLCRTCQAKCALRPEPTLSMAEDGSARSAGMVPRQPRSRRVPRGSGSSRGLLRVALSKLPPRAWKSFIFRSLREERGTPASCSSSGEVTSSELGGLENTNQFCRTINFDVLQEGCSLHCLHIQAKPCPALPAPLPPAARFPRTEDF